MTVNVINDTKLRHVRSVRFVAGETYIKANFTIFHAGVQFSAIDMEFSYYFEPMNEYTVIGAARDMKWGVNIFRGRSINDINQIAFVPFTIQPVLDGTGRLINGPK
jgi:hypothetical protein